MGLLVVGSIGLDSVKTPFGEAREVLGGSAVYFSTSASFFTRVRMVAVVGSDFPERCRRFLEGRNVDLAGLEILPGKTFRWTAEYGKHLADARTLSTCLNVFGEFNPRLSPVYRKSRYVFLSNIDPELQERVLGQVISPRLIASDSMNFWIERKNRELKRVLKKIDVFFANENEARQLSGEANLLRAGKAILAYGPRAAVIKKGEHGALLVSRRFCFATPGFLLETVRDPTGAGDSFAGGFLGYLARSGRVNEAGLRRAVIYGNVLASFAVEDFSLRRLEKLTRREIKKRYAEYRKLVCF